MLVFSQAKEMVGGFGAIYITVLLTVPQNNIHKPYCTTF